MREYLFRGKRIYNGEWVEGFLVKKADPLLGVWSCFILVQEFDTSCIDGRQTILKSEMTWYKVDPETVGQDTGLKDKNGKTIFEGDIVLFGETTLVVYWNGEAFGWCAKAEQYPFRRFPSCRDWDYIDLGWIAAEAPCTGEITTEIIGNIHDNPEILKEGGE